MEVVNFLAEKVKNLLLGQAIEEIGYIWNYSKNVKKLTEEVERLMEIQETLGRRINVAKGKGKDPKELEKWIHNLNNKISEATKFINEEAESTKTCCDLPFCVNLFTLNHYSKMATRKTSFLLLLKTEGEHFRNLVFDPLPTPGFTDLYQPKDLEDIYTQKSTLEKIIRAIKDVQVVGITGLGGVGKTTLASEASAKMKNQFDYIESITVSPNFDAKVIKEQVQLAAKRIRNGERVLIILDDVWEELQLDEVGIPCGRPYMNCKILLTSRKESVCEAMDAKIIKLKPLKEKEAWTMFERVVGEPVWNVKLKKVALDIVKECNGLPLFIQAVGKTLKNKDIKSWEALLDRLQDPTDKDVPFKRKGIMQLKLSYDNLESEVAKLCFLLCSMFHEDETIDLQRLTCYALALGIFNNPHSSIQKAKHRVQVAVDSLKSSFLLLPQSKNSFKMHDLVRDMAILITSKGNKDEFWEFLVLSGRGLKEWQPNKDLESYKKISLMGNRISNLHNHDLLFPHLDTFLIQDNYLITISDEFFQGMEKLKLLDMSGNKISSLPQSLRNLTKLCALDLSRNKYLSEISILGELTFLEILLLRETRITYIPEEIGRLINLKLLDVYSCEYLSYVTPGVISKLIKLEELYVGLEEENCNFLLELSESLKILHLKVPKLHNIPKGVPFEALTEFLIVDEYLNEDIWDAYLMDVAHDCNFILRISRIIFPLTMTVMKLIQLSEMLILRGISNLNSVLPDLYPEVCDKLCYIDLRGCGGVRSLVKTHDLDAKQTSNELRQSGDISKVEKIKLYDLDRSELLWDAPHHYTSFCNLEKIKISDCHSLKELFPLSVAQTLVNLRDLEITNCSNLVVVISSRDEETSGSKTELVKHDTDVVFPLTRIKLQNLQELESFYSGHYFTKYPSLTDIIVYKCARMKKWSYGGNHMPHIKFQNEGISYSNINDYVTAQLEMTSNLVIYEKRYWGDGEGYSSWTTKALILDRQAMLIENHRVSLLTIRAATRFIENAKMIGT